MDNENKFDEPNQSKEAVNEKADKFKRIASKRTQKIIDGIELLGNCANSYVYTYTDDQVKTIFDAIRSVLNDTESKFKSNSPKKKTFQL
jgi:hypothetical protein